MTQDEIKRFIADKTNDGLTLTAIQDALAEQGVKLRFMELRMLAAEIESVLQKKAEDKAPAPVPEKNTETEKESTAVQDEAAPAAEPETTAQTPGLRGQTTVTLSPIQRPGYAASGTVTFGSGATAEWFLDQTGRLALDNANGQPDQQDIREFQMELRKVFGA